MQFAKLFESEKYGQILVKIDRDTEEGAPEVRFYVEPPELGVCSFAMGFTDDDAGWDAGERFFKKVDQAEAEKMAKQVFAACGIEPF